MSSKKLNIIDINQFINLATKIGYKNIKSLKNIFRIIDYYWKNLELIKDDVYYIVNYKQCAISDEAHRFINQRKNDKDLTRNH